MNLNLNEIIVLGTFIISIVALMFSAFAFFRGRNIDLQNQLYLKKLDAYENTISEFFKLLSLLRNNHEKLLSMDMNNLSEFEKNELNSLSYLVDNEIEEIQKTIGIKSVYFSKSMLDNILSYLISLYGDLEWNNIKDNNDIPKLMESYIQTQTEEMESLINQMGDELGLDNLNQKLFKRIKKGRFRFDV